MNTIQNNAYALEAFPTEKMLKVFQPDRGMTFEIPLDVPTDVGNAILKAMRGHCAAQFPWSKVDLTPVLIELGNAFGYDPALLAEGKGETGRTGHSWTAYAHRKSLPMMVVWEAEEARMLLTANLGLGALRFGSSGPNIRLELRLVGDEKANEKWMVCAAAALSNLESERKEQGEISLPAGDVMVRVALSQEGMTDRNRVIICTHEDGSVPENRKKEVIQLSRTRALVLTKPSNPWPDSMKSIPVPGQAEVCRSRFGHSRLSYRPEEAIPQNMILDFQMESAVRCIGEFNAELGATFSDPKACVRQEMLEEHRVLDSLEARERRLTLRETMRILKECGRRDTTISFSPAMHQADGEDLKGTGRNLAMRAGDVGPSDDLIELGLWRLENLRADEVGAGRGRAKGGLRAEFDIDPARGAESDDVELQDEIVDLATPYFSSHMGMPVRVSKSLRIWRRNDEECLAIDFYACRVAYENENPAWLGFDSERVNHVHFADIYKVPRKR